MFFSGYSGALQDLVLAEFITSEEWKIHLVRTMQFWAKNILMGNALILDLIFLFLKRFWYFCLKKSHHSFSLELTMTLIALLLIVPALRTHLLLLLIVAAGASNCHWKLLA